MDTIDDEKDMHCARCGNEEIGFGLYGELCESCDNDMRLQCMDRDDI